LLVSCVGLEATASLIVAAADLHVVQLIRGAMRAADAASGRPEAVSGLGPAPTFRRIAAREVLHPEPRIEPRRVIHPEPRFEPRPVLHPAPTIQPSIAPPPEDCSGPAHSGCLLLPPPWRMPVWNIPIEPKPAIKTVVHRTDVHHKGSLLDLFI
jgi:hypothetical protein